MKKTGCEKKGSPYPRRTENDQENVFVILVKQEKIIQIYINTCICVFLHMVFTSNAVNKSHIVVPF